ncbi:iron uptake porin [Prochlorococcus sp. MIT 1307]|uniref:iron uptake porin n=1 Tax=Prochlorococcus sp. MIT 1307 TaxID=3096219 RepID=UPI002A75F5CF|nr:iron uptake porin [Prochlorococcus sp. MIT 1307]
MKLFQQLLVAPAALGLMAPIAATAAELNINDVSSYSDSTGVVESISQFSDVYPTDWAYQALTDLAERHGCAAADPSGSMTRYEAAALLNKCLGNVAQVNEEERRLINEFGPELAVIKGRIDGLEARVGEFEAGMFSTTTKLTGKTYFVLGGYGRDTNSGNAEQDDGSLTFNYTTQLNLNTSFTGEDLLYTRIKTGNFSNSAFGSKTYGNYLSATNNNADALKVDKIWYQFPVGENFTVWAGPKIENYYMLASSPSIYKPVMKQFALGGNSGAYAASTDGGFGVAWTQSVDDPTQPRFAVSTNIVSKGASNATDEGGGIFTDAQQKWLTKFEYGAPRWQVSFAVANEMCNDKSGTNTESCKAWQEYYATDKGNNAGTGNATSYSARAYWKPEDVGMIPAIQVGYDVRDIDDDDSQDSVEATAAWMVGLMWDDVFVDGNRAGVAFGSRAHATEIQGKHEGNDDDAAGNFVWEAYYDYKVSDNITVTPAVFGGSDVSTGENDDILGGLVQTTFKF